MSEQHHRAIRAKRLGDFEYLPADLHAGDRCDLEAALFKMARCVER